VSGASTVAVQTVASGSSVAVGSVVSGAVGDSVQVSVSGYDAQGAAVSLSSEATVSEGDC